MTTYSTIRSSGDLLDFRFAGHANDQDRLCTIPDDDDDLPFLSPYHFTTREAKRLERLRLPPGDARSRAKLKRRYAFDAAREGYQWCYRGLQLP
jgi:hypothetical protein